ncbi:RIPOR family member 3 isoform X3 [Saimiri boliviensis]|uniref:RIPOR family member 3 isoform X3 n=1 Tax=Saimiri boliviensis TaxID=27679 RepID=UPI003D77A561
MGLAVNCPTPRPHLPTPTTLRTSQLLVVVSALGATCPEAPPPPEVNWDNRLPYPVPPWIFFVTLSTREAEAGKSLEPRRQRLQQAEIAPLYSSLATERDSILKKKKEKQVTAMSVRLRFLSPGDTGTVGVVGRSASFAGFSSAQSRRITKSISRNSVRLRMPAKSSKMYSTLRKGSVCADPKPQQVKKIFEALKRGLKEHLCVQQAELDHLSGCHKDTRRNSRLAFYYDLDKDLQEGGGAGGSGRVPRRLCKHLPFFWEKQTRYVERHIRKMEFHISKVDELYEDYCIQCRLRDGASSMQQAFARCPPSRAARESLQELGRSLHECAEDMWLIEGALEVHLGQFHIRMKGLVGYARLCPGDQYEVLMRLGRQRWKLKGRIESDDSQTWDEEEKAFIPTLHENLDIKVTELRGLGSLAVGAVTCDIADFFTTRPQVIVVDITELGTIKLQLQMQWNPFDTESFVVSPSPTGKFSMGSRKGSLYNWTPPSTPSFRERYYLSVLQQPTQQALLLGGPRTTPILSYLSDSDLQGPSLRSQSQELPEMDSFSSEDPRDTETSTSASTSDVGFLPLAISPHASIEEEAREDPPSPGVLPQMAHLSGGPFAEQPGWRHLGVETPSLPRGSPFPNGTAPSSQKGHEKGATGDREDGPGLVLEGPLQEVLELLRPTDSTQPQLRELEYQVLGFRDRLKPCRARQEHASAESLMEYILESFAFLSADFTPDELSLFGGSQGPRAGPTPPVTASLEATQPAVPQPPRASASTSPRTEQQRLNSFSPLHGAGVAFRADTCFRPSRVAARGSGHRSSLYHRAGLVKDQPSPPPPSLKTSSRELTAGAPELDVLLTVHLQVCKALLQKLASPDLSRLVQECLLEEVAQQKHVLETLSVLDFEKVGKATSIEEIIPQASRRKGCLKLWRGCTGPGRVLSCPAATLLNQLKKTFLHRVRGKYPGQLEIVCRRLLEQVVSCGGLLPGAGLPEDQTITWFQFHSYLQRQSVSDLEKHFTQLTKEVTLIEELHCTGQAKAVRKLQGKRLGQLQPLPQTLTAWALLQLDGTPRVCRAASARLAGAVRNRSFREKALLFYTNALAENDARLQQAACLALKQLKGVESIDQIASLCQSDLEAVRAAARETTLSFGEKGRLAFERMGKLCSEQKEVFGQEADVEITVF